jgi:hypothetical protein
MTDDELWHAISQNTGHCQRFFTDNLNWTTLIPA